MFATLPLNCKTESRKRKRRKKKKKNKTNRCENKATAPLKMRNAVFGLLNSVQVHTHVKRNIFAQLNRMCERTKAANQPFLNLCELRWFIVGVNSAQHNPIFLLDTVCPNMHQMIHNECLVHIVYCFNCVICAKHWKNFWEKWCVRTRDNTMATPIYVQQEDDLCCDQWQNSGERMEWRKK